MPSPGCSRSVPKSKLVQVSPLTTTKRSPRCASALTMPPAVSSAPGGSSHTVTFTPKRLPSPRKAISLSFSQLTLTTMSVKPASRRCRMCHSINGRPRTSSMGLGVSSVSGRMRSPRPAARIIAFMASKGKRQEVRSERTDNAATSPLTSHLSPLTFIPPHQLQQPRKLLVLRADVVHVAEEARRFGEVFRLAVAVVESCEDADDLEMPLQAHPVEGAAKILGQDKTCGLRATTVFLHPGIDPPFRPGKEGVLEQRQQVVGDGSAHRVLEIDDGKTFRHHQVAWHEVAMHEHLRLRQRGLHQPLAGGIPGAALISAELNAAVAGEIPVGIKRKLAHQQRAVIIRQAFATHACLHADEHIQRP